MRGINHPAKVFGMIHSTGIHTFHQFIENEEELIRFDTAYSQVVISVFTVIKMETGELAFH